MIDQTTMDLIYRPIAEKIRKKTNNEVLSWYTGNRISQIHFEADHFMRGTPPGQAILRRSTFAIIFDEMEAVFIMDKKKRWCLVATRTTKNLGRRTMSLQSRSTTRVGWIFWDEKARTEIGDELIEMINFVSDVTKGEHLAILKGRKHPLARHPLFWLFQAKRHEGSRWAEDEPRRTKGRFIEEVFRMLDNLGKTKSVSSEKTLKELGEIYGKKAFYTFMRHLNLTKDEAEKKGYSDWEILITHPYLWMANRRILSKVAGETRYELSEWKEHLDELHEALPALIGDFVEKTIKAYADGGFTERREVSDLFGLINGDLIISLVNTGRMSSEGVNGLILLKRDWRPLIERAGVGIFSEIISEMVAGVVEGYGPFESLNSGKPSSRKEIPEESIRNADEAARRLLVFGDEIPDDSIEIFPPEIHLDEEAQKAIMGEPAEADDRWGILDQGEVRMEEHIPQTVSLDFGDEIFSFEREILSLELEEVSDIPF